MQPNVPRPPLPLVVVTQLLFAATFLIIAGVLALFPMVSVAVADSEPTLAHIQPGMLGLAMAFCVTAMIGVASVALLVERIRRGTILEQRSLRWVDVLVSTLIAGVVLVVAALVALHAAGAAGPPGLVIVMLATAVALAAIAGVTLVLRALLGESILIRTELESVV